MWDNMEKEKKGIKICGYVVLGIGAFGLFLALLVLGVWHFASDSINAWFAAHEAGPGSILPGIFMAFVDTLLVSGGKYTALIFAIISAPFILLGILILIIDKLVKNKN